MVITKQEKIISPKLSTFKQCFQFWGKIIKGYIVCKNYDNYKYMYCYLKTQDVFRL